VFLDTVAIGYQVVTITTHPGSETGWCLIHQNQRHGVTVGVTNTTAGTTIGDLAQNLVI